MTIISAEQLQATTPSDIPDGLNKLPVFGGSNVPRLAGNGGGGTSSSGGVPENVLALRNFGDQRTLVLLDGHRAPPTNADGSVDIDTLPQMLVSRVDVVTGGASAVYGSDAVSGVVNFILDKNFDGLKFDANAGIYNHSNHEHWLDPLLQAEGSPVPTGSNWDGANKDLTLIMGHNFADGAGNFEGYLGYRRTDPITANTRCWMSARWIRMDPPPISLPLATMS